MAKDSMENKEDENKKIFLDEKEITIDQLQEARRDPAKRIVEDNGNPGHYRTLTRMQG